QQILQLKPNIITGLEVPDARVPSSNQVIAHAHPERIIKRPVNTRLNQIRPRPVIKERETRPKVPAKVLRGHIEGRQLRDARKALEPTKRTGRQVVIRGQTVVGPSVPGPARTVWLGRVRRRRAGSRPNSVSIIGNTHWHPRPKRVIDSQPLIPKHLRRKG